MLPLEKPTRPYPCNPIQGHREAGVCPSMHWMGAVLLHLATTDRTTHLFSLIVIEEFETGYVQYLNLLALNENKQNRIKMLEVSLLWSRDWTDWRNVLSLSLLPLPWLTGKGSSWYNSFPVCCFYMSDSLTMESAAQYCCLCISLEACFHN